MDHLRTLLLPGISKSTSVGVLCVLGSNTSVPITWMSKKQTAVSHSSAESEINYYDAGLIPALQWWDCVLETFSHSDGKRNLARPSGKRHLFSHFIDHMSCDKVDHFPRNISEGSFPRRFLFENNEAVIRMIIKDRSPNLRQVSRTHRVDLDWLFGIVTLDRSMSIRHVRTAEQTIG